MNVPTGSLLRKRVVDDPATALASALDREVTGYLRLSSQSALLLGDEGAGVLTLSAGVPVVAYHTGSDRGGPPALGDMAQPGPYGMALFELPGPELHAIHEARDLRVPPGLPAERLAGEDGLAARTRDAAPEGRVEAHDRDRSTTAVEAFLEDEEKITRLQEQARAEAAERAAEWDL